MSSIVVNNILKSNQHMPYALFNILVNSLDVPWQLFTPSSAYFTTFQFPDVNIFFTSL